MKKVYLLCSEHEEKDRFTIQAYYEKLMEIQPDCIFEEVPVNMFDDIYLHHKFPDSLEVAGTRRYLEQHPEARHFGVDIDRLPEVFRMLFPGDDYDEQCDTFIKESTAKEAEELRQLKEQKEELAKEGIDAINSPRYRELWHCIQEKQFAFLKKNNPDLYFKYRGQEYFHYEIRECFMMTEILKHIHEAKRPLICIGSAHYESISGKLKDALPDVQIISEQSDTAQ
ncbi:MAG: hypothetical protein MJ178_04425 [Treponemataceae bacterium]|nr:hypothetical protein [Treponemataceae bacterium]